MIRKRFWQGWWPSRTKVGQVGHLSDYRPNVGHLSKIYDFRSVSVILSALSDFLVRPLKCPTHVGQCPTVKVSDFSRTSDRLCSALSDFVSDLIFQVGHQPQILVFCSDVNNMSVQLTAHECILWSSSFFHKLHFVVLYVFCPPYFCIFCRPSPILFPFLCRPFFVNNNFSFTNYYYLFSTAT